MGNLAASVRAFRAKIRVCVLQWVLLFLIPTLSQAQSSLIEKWAYTPITSASAVTYSPDGRLIAVCGYRGIQIYQASTDILLACIPTTIDVTVLAFSPDSKTLADGGSAYGSTGQVGVVELWNVSTGTLINTLNTSEDVVNAVAFSPNGSTLADCGYSYSDQYVIVGAVELWAIATGNQISSANSQGNYINSVAFSADSKTIADGGGNKTSLLEFRSAATGDVIGTLKSSATTVDSVAFSSDGKTFADGGTSTLLSANQNIGVVELWNASTGNRISSLGTNNATVNSIAFSPDGKSIADGGVISQSLETGMLELWSVVSGKLITTLDTSFDNSVSNIAFSPDGKTLADCGTVLDSTYYSEFSVLDLWDVSSGELKTSILTAPYFNTNPVVFSPDGKVLANGGTASNSNSHGQRGFLGLWDSGSGQLVQSIYSGTYVNAIAFSLDSSLVATGGSATSVGVLQLWNANTGNLVNSFSTATEEISAVAFSPDGTVLADAGITYNTSTFVTKGVVELWDVATGRLIATLNSSANNGIGGIAFSSDGKTLVVGGGGWVHYGDQFGVLELWDVVNDSFIASLETGLFQINSVAFSPDGKTICDGGMEYQSSTNSINGGLELWDSASDTLLSSLLPESSTRGVNSIAFSANSLVVFAATDLGMQAFSVSNFALLSSYEGVGVSSIAVSPSGGLLAFDNTSSQLEVASNPYNGTNLVSSVTLSPTTVLGGGSVNGIVTLSQPAPAGGIPVLLSTDSVSASVPATLTVASGMTTASFTMSTSGVNNQTVVKIVASTGLGSQSASLTITPAQLIGMNLKPTTVGGGSTSAGSVTLNGPAGPAATVPDTVTVAAGQTTGSFTVSTTATAVQEVADITTSLNGQWQTVPLTITTAFLAQLTVTPNLVAGGNNATGTVTLSGTAGPSGFVVALSSDRASAVVPKSVTVQSGQSTATFTISTAASSTQQVATLTAKNGGTSVNGTLTISPPSLQWVTLSPDYLSGGATSTGKVVLTGTAYSNTVIKLTSNTSSAIVPSSVTIKSGQTSGSFTVKTVPVIPRTVATISGVLNGVTKMATLYINPPILQSVGFSPSSVIGGMSSTGTVTLNEPASVGGIKVSLSSSVTAAAVPKTVTVLAGKLSATFIAKTVAVNVQTLASVTAAFGYISQTGTLTINAPTLKSLTVSPTTVVGGKSSTGTVTVTSPAPVGGLVIALSSSSSSASVPATITVPVGKTEATFTIKTTQVKSKAVSNISASLAGVSKTVVLTVS